MTTLLTPQVALAANNDDWKLSTTNGCGVVNFVDYGPGAPGGGDNDDYLVIHDYCADGHGVTVDVHINGLYWGRGYNGNGAAGAAVIYDPFKTWSSYNLLAGDELDLDICLADGRDDWTGLNCAAGWHTMIDG